MIGVLGEAAFRTLLLAAAVQLGLWLLRVRRAQLLLVTWTAVLAASLAMPALQWATPLRWPIVAGHFTTLLIGAADVQRQAAAAAPSESIAAADVQALPAIGVLLRATYLLVSSIMLLRLIVGVTLSFQLLRKAAPVRLASAPNTCIRISRAVAAPVTVGCVILLPADVVDWPEAMCQAAIAHECAHVARGDFAWLVVSQINRALFWFSPVPWLLHSRLAALAELVSDDHAMQVTGDRTGYAEVLLEMGRRSGPLLRGLAMARASTLPQRIERVLSDRMAPSQISGLQRSAILVGASIVAIAAASPDFNPGVPPTPAASARRVLALAPTNGFDANPVQAVNPSYRPPPMLPDTEEAGQPASPSAAPLTRAARVTPQQPSAVQVVSRRVPRPPVSNTHAWPAVRAAQIRNQAISTQGESVARINAEALGQRRTPSGIVDVASRSNTINAADEVGHVPPSQRDVHPALAEPSLLKVIDQQTCNGLYLPASVGGALNSSSWGALNMIRAKFFREADGTSWLKFSLGARDPVNLPVTVTAKEVEFTAAFNTSFKMLPQGTNHLTGTTQRPYGTIDFACGENGAHLFDHKS